VVGLDGDSYTLLLYYNIMDTYQTTSIILTYTLYIYYTISAKTFEVYTHFAKHSTLAQSLVRRHSFLPRLGTYLDGYLHLYTYTRLMTAKTTRGSVAKPHVYNHKSSKKKKKWLKHKWTLRS
jgi:hypothetical protein